MKRVLLIFSVLIFSFCSDKSPSIKESNGCFNFKNFQKFTRANRNGTLDLKTIDDENVLKNYEELKEACIKDTIIHLSYCIQKCTSEDIKEAKKFYSTKPKLIFYDSNVSNSKLNLFSIISYVNSNYTKMFLVSITKDGHLNFIIETSNIGGDAGYSIEKSTRMINDSNFLSVTIDKEIIFNEKGLPDSLRYDSIITNYNVLFGKKILENKKYYPKKTKLNK